MQRQPLVAGNWKMHHSDAEAAAWCEALRQQLDAAPLAPGQQLAVAPAFTALHAVAAAVGAGLPLELMAQNVHEEPKGAFTGEVSVDMLRAAGVRAAIIGHSERRHVFGESDERIAAKVAASLSGGLRAVLCIGETQEERDAGKTEEICERQLRAGLGRAGSDPKRIVVAYEPVWAIGTGRVATPEQVSEAHAFVRGVMGEIGGSEAAAQVRLLYGGSVKPGNAGELAAIADVDGFLVGGASLEAESFLAIARACAGAKGL